MLRSCPILLLLALALAGLAGEPASAAPATVEDRPTDATEETPVQDASVALATLFVVSDFRPVRIQELDTSITVFDRQTIELATIEHFEELVQLVPNMNLSGEGSRARYFQLRGIGEREQYDAEGAAPVAGRPGVFQTIPRVIGQGLLRPGSRARFTWTILVSKGVPDDFAGLGVQCSLCAELAQKSAPAATFSNPSTFGRRHHIPDLVLGNRPLNIRVTQIGREPQHLRRFESDLDARTIPGLEQRILRENGEIAILGCKPTAVLIDPFSNNEPLLKDDLIVIRIDVPETERARLFADPTSCEISYLRARPSH